MSITLTYCCSSLYLYLALHAHISNELVKSETVFIFFGQRSNSQDSM